MAVKAHARQARDVDAEMTLEIGPPLSAEHKNLIKILARESVEDFLREICQSHEEEAR